jgi:hypothetical protein
MRCAGCLETSRRRSRGWSFGFSSAARILGLLDALMLRVPTVDVVRGQLTVRDPKRKHDRTTMISASVTSEMHEQLVEARLRRRASGPRLATSGYPARSRASCPRPHATRGGSASFGRLAAGATRKAAKPASSAGHGSSARRDRRCAICKRRQARVASGSEVTLRRRPQLKAQIPGYGSNVCLDDERDLAASRKRVSLNLAILHRAPPGCLATPRRSEVKLGNHRHIRSCFRDSTYRA